ncbi:MAG: DUF1800 domain-containing protein [Spirosomaceae bacterium]|jgi:uncharacterized protein (DUF1800 family)|nr:DUF1800 domain-containing protein [Spirosomataceae bacterium]
MPLQPYTGTFGTAELQHLLRRTLFGYTKDDINYFSGKKLSEVVDHLLQILPQPDPPVRMSNSYRYDVGVRPYGIEVPQYIPNDQNNTFAPGAGTSLIEFADFQQTTTPPATYPTPTTLSQTYNTYLNSGGYIGPNNGAGNMNTQWVKRVPAPYFDNHGSLLYWWQGQMLNHTSRASNIRTKMTLFLHNLLPVENKLNALYSYQYVNLLYTYALGSYKDLVEKMTIEPLMLHYLNGDGSSMPNPNENYARELLELFTIGKKSDINPHISYSEDDVKKIARVLTGWYINPIPSNPWNVETGYRNRIVPNNPNGMERVLFDPQKHDNNPVTLSPYFHSVTIGLTAYNPLITPMMRAKNKIKSLIDVIFSKNDVAKHIVRKLYRFFVYGFADKHECSLNDTIENSIITPLSQTLINNNYNLKPVLKELLMSEHFFTQKGTLVKSPFDLVVGTLRLFDLDKQVPPIKKSSNTYDYHVSTVMTTKCLARYNMWYNAIEQQVFQMGMQLFYPPNVAGWSAYHQEGSYSREWVTSSVFLNARMNFLKKLLIIADSQYDTALSIPRVLVNQPLNSSLGYDTESGNRCYSLYLHGKHSDGRHINNYANSELLALVKKIVGTQNTTISYDDFLNALFDYFLAIRPVAGNPIWGEAGNNLQKQHWISSTNNPWYNYLNAASSSTPFVYTFSYPYVTTGAAFTPANNAECMHFLLVKFFENCIFKSPDFQLM